MGIYEYNHTVIKALQVYIAQTLIVMVHKEKSATQDADSPNEKKSNL